MGAYTSRLNAQEGLGIAVGAVAVVTVVIAVALVYAPHGGPCTPDRPQEPTGAIPEQLFMTGPWAEDTLPGPIRDSVESWRRHGPPGLRIHWFDEPAREAWVAKYFPQYLDAYRSLVPGAYQADLWRVLVLYANGGVYSDAGTLLQAPLWSIMQGCSLVYCRDRDPKDVFQKVIACAPQHPVMLATAKLIAANVGKQFYGASCLSPTGPEAYGHAFRNWYLNSGVEFALLPFALPSQEWRVGKHGRSRVLYFDGKAVYKHSRFLTTQKAIFQTKVPSYTEVMYTHRKVKSYGELWRERAMYRNLPLQKPSIPSRLFMTGPFSADKLPSGFAGNVAAWKRFGPSDLLIHWFDDHDAESWIRTNYPQYLAEYQVLVPGAFKADLWRLLVLYEYGGVYADAGTSITEPLWQMFRDVPLFFCSDSDVRDIWQGIIGAVAGHPVIWAMIEHVVSNIRGRKYGDNPLSVTGPKAVAAAARQVLMSAKAPVPPFIAQDGTWVAGHYPGLAFILASAPQSFAVTTAAKQVVAFTKNPGYYHTMYTKRNKTRYHFLWHDRAIYADGRRAVSVIPHRLFITAPFARDAIPEPLRNNIRAWERLGPQDLEIHWFDDADAEAWVREHYPEYLEEYQVLVPGAFKADLWRLLVLYKHGGMYADAGTSPLVPIWPEFYEATLVLCHDAKVKSGQGDLWQGVLAATPGHPVIWAMAAHVLNNIRKRFYGWNPLAVTGPKAVSLAAKAALTATQVGLWDEKGNWNAGDHGHIVIWEGKPGAIHTAKGVHIINTKVPNYNTIMYKNRGLPRYGVLWKQRAIYKASGVATVGASATLTTQPRWCVLLTTCIKPIIRRADTEQERTRAYSTSFAKWFGNTQEQEVPVFVVESSGTALPGQLDPRVTAVFKLEADPASTSLTHTEADSVLHAFSVLAEPMEPCTHVLKVTGRYFLPNVGKLLASVPDVDIVLQHTHTPDENHTEVLGFRKSLAPALFDGIPPGRPIEAHVLHVIARDNLSTFRLPPIPNVLKVKRGAGDIVDPL